MELTASSGINEGIQENGPNKMEGQMRANVLLARDIRPYIPYQGLHEYVPPNAYRLNSPVLYYFPS